MSLGFVKEPRNHTSRAPSVFIPYPTVKQIVSRFGQLIIQELIHNESANVFWLLSQLKQSPRRDNDDWWNLSDTALYHRIRRFLLRLDELGFLENNSTDGVRFFKANGLISRLVGVSAVDLIQPTQNSNQLQNGAGNNANQPRKKRVSSEKELAQDILKNSTYLGEHGLIQLSELFNQYKEDKAKRVIWLQKDDQDKDGTLGDNLFIEYNHRFKKHQLNKKYAQFKDQWDFMSHGANTGVFLTITMNPQLIPNLYQANKLAPILWNKLRSWIIKVQIRDNIKTIKLPGKRHVYKECKKCHAQFRSNQVRAHLKECDPILLTPQYLKVAEFQLKKYNGRIHYHIVFFGIRRLADKFTELTPELERLRFGKMNFIYTIYKDRKGSWHWDKNKHPADARNRPPEDYLAKYMRKDLYGSNPREDYHSLYWAVGNRFFTNSLLRTEEDKQRFKEYIELKYSGKYSRRELKRLLELKFGVKYKKGYRLKSSFNFYHVPDWALNSMTLEEYQQLQQFINEAEREADPLRGGDFGEFLNLV